MGPCAASSTASRVTGIGSSCAIRSRVSRFCLMNNTHLQAETPFRSSYAIYVREGARDRYDRVNEVPELFRSRVLSLRAFDGNDMLCDANIAQGGAVENLIERLLSSPQTAYVHAHYAKPGCFCRADRSSVDHLAADCSAAASHSCTCRHDSFRPP